MIRGLIFIICFFNCFCRAQDIDEPYIYFVQLVRNNEVSRIQEEGTKWLTKHEAEDTTYAAISGFVAYAYFSTGHYSEALQYGQTDVSTREKLENTNNLPYTVSLYYLAIYYSYNHDYVNAAQTLSRLDQLYTTMEQVSADVKLNIKWQLASMLSSTGRIPEAEVMYHQVGKGVDSLYNETDSLSQVYNNTMAVFYMTNEMFDKAEPYYISATKLMQKTYGKNSAEAFYSVNSLGEFYMYIGRYDQAEKIFSKAVSIASKALGETHADYATALNNLAVSYDYTGQNQKSIQTYEKVLKIKQQIYTTQSDYYAISVMNLGSALQRAGNIPEALTHYLTSLKIYDMINDTSSLSNYGTCLSHLASIYKDLGQLDSAELYQQKSISLQEESYGKYHQGYFNTLSAYIPILIAQSRFEKAKIIALECLAI